VKKQKEKRKKKKEKRKKKKEKRKKRIFDQFYDVKSLFYLNKFFTSKF
jgi:hypothetical protein